MQISSALTRRWSLVALVALLGLAVTVATTSASGASAGQAIAAKKKHKCKKGKKSAAAAKKKKCKKKKKKTVTVPPATSSPAPTAPSGPVVRAHVTWTVADPTQDEADIDVHAWSIGAHTGYSEVHPTDDVEIPNLVYQPGFESGLEQLVDQTNPSTRLLTFAICSYYYPDADPATVTYHFVFANGTTLDGTKSMDPGEIKVIDPQEGGAFTDPRDEWCPAPPP